MSDQVLHVVFKDGPTLCGLGMDGHPVGTIGLVVSRPVRVTDVEHARCKHESAKQWGHEPVCPECWHVWEERFADRDHGHTRCFCPLGRSRREAAMEWTPRNN